MKPENFSQEDWDALTEDEQLGMLEDINEDVPAGDDIEHEADVGTGEGNTDNAEAAKQQSADQSEADQVKAYDQEQQAYEYKPKPMFDAKLPENYDDQVKAIRQQKRELAEKFDEGEISVAEYQDQLDDLNDKQADLREIKFKAELANEAQKNAAEDDWGTTVQSFLSSHPETSKSDFRLNAFDLAVRMVTSNEANAKLSNQEQLELAYKNFAAELGLQVQAGKAPPAQQQRRAKPVVPNIGDIPAADIQDTDNGKFAALDRLIDTDPIRYQDELARLSASDREAYLAM